MFSQLMRLIAAMAAKPPVCDVWSFYWARIQMDQFDSICMHVSSLCPIPSCEPPSTSIIAFYVLCPYSTPNATTNTVSGRHLRDKDLVALIVLEHDDIA